MLIWVRKLKFYFPENHKKTLLFQSLLFLVFSRQDSKKWMKHIYLEIILIFKESNNWEEDEVGSLEVHLRNLYNNENFSNQIYHETSSNYDVITTSDNFFLYLSGLNYLTKII